MTQSPDSKRAHDKPATRARVLASARALFADLGYEGVTIRMVAAAAGFSTGAVFGHWAGKDELFAEAMGRPHLTDARGAELLDTLKAVAPDVADDLLNKWAA